MKYQIVEAKDPREMERKLAEMKGWLPTGGIVVHQVGQCVAFFQAVYKPDKQGK